MLDKTGYTQEDFAGYAECKMLYCEKCSSPLLKAEGNADLEIVCLNCRWMNYPLRDTVEKKVTWPKGNLFVASGAVPHYCWQCHRLMFLSRAGDGKYIKRCKYCKVDTLYDTVLMKAKRMVYPSNEKSRKTRESLAR